MADTLAVSQQRGKTRSGDPDVRARAAELGATLDDRAVFALASEVMRSAQEISA